MPGRVVVQWDKDDCADLGIIKIDLLGLGMLAVLEEAIPLVARARRRRVDLAHLPPDDPGGLCDAAAGRHGRRVPGREPRADGDAAADEAAHVLRPGGRGRDHPSRPDRRPDGPSVSRIGATGASRSATRIPSLEPILRRTLGVPLFQEQLLRMAMTVAGFSGGEAEELRRAMGFKRSAERMEKIEQRLRDGMARNGITGAAADQIVQVDHLVRALWVSRIARRQLRADRLCFGLSEMPSSRRRFSPRCSTAIRSASIIRRPWSRTRERHGVTIRPIDVAQSDWHCTHRARRAAARTQIRQRPARRDRPAHRARARAAVASSRSGELRRPGRAQRRELDRSPMRARSRRSG